MTKNERVNFIWAGIIFIIVMSIVLWLKLIDTAQAIQITISFILVLVTYIYVKRTSEIAGATREQAEASRQQAEASVKMAEEMREQRYEAVRPIIDFRFRDSESRSGGSLGIGARGELPPELHGYPCNIGIGPAIDLYSFSQVDKVIRPRDDFEALKAGESSSISVALSVMQEGSMGILKIYYRDVYGNPFRSRIEIYPVEGEGLRTKLQATKVEEDEYDKRSYSNFN